MSRFFSGKYKNLTPYTPGEQPRDRRYLKLNTNESPFPPSPRAVAGAQSAAKGVNLYSDPACKSLTDAAALALGVKPEQVIFGNGSDEILNFAFMAFCDETCPAVFPDITYGFYPVFARVNGVPCREIPLKEDFTVDITDYFHAGGTIFLANPNAPTGIALSLAQIEAILKANPDHPVVIDEAYVDFGGESAVKLIDRYDNLLVVQTFSKSRSLAGARLGMGFGNPGLIRDLHTIRYSTNPYNVNAMTMAAGVGALEDDAYFRRNCRTIMENRSWTVAALGELGFEVVDSLTNFVFARHPRLSGEAVYRSLRNRGILVRHFSHPRITDHNRITIGTKEQMETLVQTLKDILEEIP